MKTDRFENDNLLLTPEKLLDVFFAHQGISREQLTLPSRAALAFQKEGLDPLIGLSQAKPCGDWSFPISEAPLYQGKYLGETVLVALIPPSAPNAVAFVECLISLGINRIIVTGAAGSIHPSAQAASLVIPTQAIREEGTSYHYLGKGIEVHSSPLLVELLKEFAGQNQVPILCGPTWTTDGVFRETVREMKHYSSQGILTVEMEMAALFALAMSRKIDLAGLLVISDTHFDGHKITVFDQAYRNAQVYSAKVLLAALCGGQS